MIPRSRGEAPNDGSSIEFVYRELLNATAFDRFQIEGLLAREGAKKRGAGDRQVATASETAQEAHA